MAASLGRGGANSGITRDKQLLELFTSGNSAHEGQRWVVSGFRRRRTFAERLEQIQLLSRGRNVLVAHMRGPAYRVVIARRMVTSIAQFFKLAVDRVIAFGSQPLIRVAHRGEVVGEI